MVLVLGLQWHREGQRGLKLLLIRDHIEIPDKLSLIFKPDLMTNGNGVEDPHPVVLQVDLLERLCHVLLVLFEEDLVPLW